MGNGLNPNWARWTFASVAKFLKELAQTADIPALMEGLDERTTAFMEAPQRVELRMSGPFTKELSIDYFELSVDLNALFTSRYEIDGNQYDINKIVGQFHAALSDAFPILRLGDQSGEGGGFVHPVERAFRSYGEGSVAGHQVSEPQRGHQAVHRRDGSLEEGVPGGQGRRLEEQGFADRGRRGGAVHAAVHFANRHGDCEDGPVGRRRGGRSLTSERRPNSRRTAAWLSWPAADAHKARM